MKIVVLSILATMASGVIFASVVLFQGRGFVAEAENRCRALALAHPDVGLLDGQIACKLYHHDVVARIRISAQSRHEVVCVTDALSTRLPVDACVVVELRPGKGHSDP